MLDRPRAVGPGRRALLPVMALLVILTGCARTVDAAPVAPADAHRGWPGCEKVGAFTHSFDETGPVTGAIPADFAAVEALLCEVVPRTAANGDRVEVGLERRTHDVASLLAYLDRPSQRSTRPGDVICPAMVWAPPWLFLLDESGRWLAPRIPLDVCGFPLDHLGRPGPPTEGLAFAVTEVKQLRVLESVAARRSGCAQEVPDPAELDGPAPPVPEEIGRSPFHGRSVRLCRYEAASAGDGHPGGTGTFRSGRALSTTETAAVVRSLVGSPAAARRCGLRSSAFVVLQDVDGVQVHVEVSGCRRIFSRRELDGEVRWAQATPELVRLVLRLAG